jgi:hypothetical protein
MVVNNRCNGAAMAEWLVSGLDHPLPSDTTATTSRSKSAGLVTPLESALAEEGKAMVGDC